MIKNVLFCGVGGQGAVLASRILANTALKAGLNVRTAETIGMAQRGGSVVTHVRYGDEEIHSSLIMPGGADIIIAAEPGEGVRCLSYLAPGGCIVVADQCVAPVTAGLMGLNYSAAPMLEYLAGVNANVLDINSVVQQCGSPKVINVALVGLALRTLDLGLPMDDAATTLAQMLPAKLLNMNLLALYGDAALAEAALSNLSH